MFPAASHATTTTRIPASTADAAFVPCADAGIKHTSRPPSPRSACHARIASKPANSPCEPAFGCTLTAAYPHTSANHDSNSPINRRHPTVCDSGANGCTSANSGHDTGSISAAAFNFIVHEPKGIIPRSSP
jgi:hypothetical protein